MSVIMYYRNTYFLKSQTWFGDGTTTITEIDIEMYTYIGCYTYIQERAMAPHSSTLAWKVPWMEEAGGLQSMRSLRVGHDWATSLSLFTFLHWRRKWQPTPVFLPGESQGRGSLVGCRRWGRTESDTTKATWQQQQQQHKNRVLLLYSPCCY